MKTITEVVDGSKTINEEHNSAAYFQRMGFSEYVCNQMEQMSNSKRELSEENFVKIMNSVVKDLLSITNK